MLQKQTLSGGLFNILFISKDGDGYCLAKKLAEEGNTVIFWVKNPRYEAVGKGIDNPKPISRTTEKDHPKSNPEHPEDNLVTLDTWKPYVKWCDFAIFDMVGQSDKAEEIRKAGKPVVGASKIADKLEEDRVYAQDVMKKYTNCEIPEYKEFTSVRQAVKFLEDNEKLYVFKSFDPGYRTFMPTDNNDNLISYLESLKKDSIHFMLQEVKQGTEISTEGFFNGKKFVGLFNHTMERKRMMDNDLGPQLGAQGAIIWPCKADRIVKTVLLPLVPFLKEQGYVGPIDMNCLIDGENVYPLEFCGRFGYHGIENVCMLLDMKIGEFLYNLATGSDKEPVYKNEYSMAVRLHMMPLEGAKSLEGLKVIHIPKYLNPYIWLSYCQYDEKGEPVMSGKDGMVGCTVVTGRSIQEVIDESYNLIKDLNPNPDIVYRSDIGKDVPEKIRILKKAGWL